MAGESFVVSQEGKGQCIIVAKQAGNPARAAIAEDLQRWLQEITGARVPVVAAPGNTPAILLGTAADYPARAARDRLEELGPEGYVVRSERQFLWLLANSELGLQHAVYALLEAVGCRWFFADPVWTVVPKTPSLRVEVELRAKPAFDYRRVWYGWGARTPKLQADYTAWQKHNRQLGHFVTDCGHAHERYVPRALFEKHPEWFGLVKGKRQPSQLCTTNPEVQQRMIDEVLKVFRREPQRNMISVDPNDGRGYCECERCTAAGSVSDRVFHLASVVAKAVRKEFPGKWVGLYAYAFHSEPPREPFEPGVYVQVTTGFRYLKLSFDDQVTAFRKLGAKLGVYDYFSVYAWDWDLPGKAKAARVYQLAEAIRHYCDLGLSTYDAESACNWGPNGLGYWMGARLMWEPELDPKALVSDFCTHAFGKAAEPMRRLYERWATGESFSLRGLKLALLDLRQACEQEAEPAVRARLDRVAMYLHSLRLWLDYDRATRLHAGQKDEIVPRAREVIVYARRIMDTGLIHTYPMLFSDRFKWRFGALAKLEGFGLEQAEPWKKERTDIPSTDEVARSFADDLKSVEGVQAVPIEGRRFGDKLVPLAERAPEAVQAWGEAKRSPLCVETGLHVFQGKKGETLRLPFKPFDAGHTVDGHWALRRMGEGDPYVAEGDAKAEKGKVATVELAIPADGLFVLDPGTNYWKTAEVGFEPRPLAVWAGRGDAPGGPKRPSFRLWLPRADQPLYFYVPKGTRHFVLGFPSIGQRFSTLILRTADGGAVLEDTRVMSGDQVSVTVPAGKDGAVWSLGLSSLRSVIELYDVPPYLSRHPAELLVPEE